MYDNPNHFESKTYLLYVVYRNHNKSNGNCTVDLLEAYNIPVKLLDKIEMDDTIDSLNSILIKITAAVKT